MAPCRRRRPSAAAALALAGLAAGAGCSGEEARAALPPQVSAAPAAPTASLPPATSTLSVVSSVHAPRRALQAPIEGVLARWRAEAARQSGGRAAPGDVRVGLHVLDPRSGAELAAIEADRPLRTASNMKLVTTAAALNLLGAEAEFVTPFEANGTLAAGVLTGDLVVRASGDPFWDPAGDGRVEDRLRAAAEALMARGLRRVTGALVLDEGRFVDPAPAPGWPGESQHWAEYCALASGLTLNAGVLVADVTSTADGQAARIAIHPAPTGLESRCGVTTGRGSPLDVLVGATPAALTVKGTIPEGHGTFRAEFRHPDPTGLFGAVLEQELRAAGIRVEGGVVRRRGVPSGERLHELRTPLRDVLDPINSDSRNSVADQLLLALGQALGDEGSRTGGSAVVARALEELGVSSQGLVQVDGSGLSRDNHASARQIVTLLAAVVSPGGAEAETFRNSLAVMGERGTLAERLVGTPAAGRVFAKTGWIAGTSALSGVARTLRGRELVFSILIEYPPELGGLNRSCFKPLQDELALLLVAAEEGA